jgi:hypothetical protein
MIYIFAVRMPEGDTQLFEFDKADEMESLAQFCRDHDYQYAIARWE